MFKRDDFVKLGRPQKERIVSAMFNAKFPGFSAETGVDVDVPAGYSLRMACILKVEEEHEVVQKIFVAMEEFNSAITSKDIEALQEYAEQLEKTKIFKKERDEFWIITNQKWTFEAYKLVKGKIVLMDLDDLVKGINKYYTHKTKQARKLRDALRHYGFA